MSLGKKYIIDNIVSKALLTSSQSKNLFQSFTSIIKKESNQKIKIQNFGVFYPHRTPQRIGRNPKTKQEYIIPSKIKLSFKAAKYLKNTIN